MKVIRLKEQDCLTNEELDILGMKWRLEHKRKLRDDDTIEGTYVDDSFYDVLIEEDCKVLKPDGSPLVIFRKKILPASVCNLAYPALRKAATEAGNRGIAAGIIADDELRIINRPAVKATANAQMRMKPIKKDGKLSNTSYAKTVPSGVIGFMDRNSRFPYCRQTAFNMHEPEKFAAALPYIKAIDKVFKDNLPDRYAAQLAYVKETPKDFIIHGTAFTTVTVNRSWQTACHRDAGDLPEGFGVMSVLEAGHYEGCNLVFPKYRVAVNMRTRDVCLADVHSIHGNTPFNGISGMYERISTVLYYRSNMIHCSTAEAERERAKNRQRGDKING